MKSKILKIITIIMLLTTLTMGNFCYVGASIISYAAEDTATNHKNIEFAANFKDDKTLVMQISVEKEGYFNGTITLGNSNFKFKNSSGNYVYEMNENSITLSQINAGEIAEIEVEIEPIQKEIFDIGLLDMENEISLNGIYKDSTEKDRNIEATRKINRNYVENNNNETVENTIEVITNKVITIDGENKRVLQLAWNLGLKNNDYPIKEIYAELMVPTIEEQKPEVVDFVTLNTMTHYEYSYNDGLVEVIMKNEPNDENQIVWKKQGNEKIILTCIYAEKADLTNTEISGEAKVTLYNEKEIKTITKAMVQEEKESIVEIYTNTLETEISKGKINAGIARDIQTTTNVEISLAKAVKNIALKEEASNYNIMYKSVSLSKAEFDKILGEDGVITILNENSELIATIDNKTEANKNGMIEIAYGEKQSKQLTIQISTPIEEGNLNFNHTKTIYKTENTDIENAEKIINGTKAEVQTYSDEVINKEKTTQINLKEAKTEATLEVSRDTLSTVIENNVEIKVVLQSNNEKQNLYKNPVITVTLPEKVENIAINSVNMLYEEELKIKNYTVEGKNIIVELEGEQTRYKEATVTGSNIIINANLKTNKKATSSEEEIIVTCLNANDKVEGKIQLQENIKIVAPKDVTTINSIPSMEVETIGQEENKNIMIAKSAEAKNAEIQIEVINNNTSKIENVQILGLFPTNTEDKRIGNIPVLEDIPSSEVKSNLDAKIVNGINLAEAIEGAKIYYSENVNATEDLQNAENGWTETIANSETVKKYLITIPEIQSQSSIQASYIMEIPANLEYNQSAREYYQVTYTNGETGVEDTLQSTAITMETGIGPKLETTLTARTGNVKNGEIICYQIQVSNVGTQDVQNIEVIGNIPEGTTMVVPEENYEYTGASYYKELEDRQYKTIIETLKIGESVTKTYEVRVNNDTTSGTELINQSEVKYGEVTKQSEEIKNIVQEGKITATVKRVTDRNTNLYETGTVQYYAIIENITNETQNNVKVLTNLSENLTVSRLTSITGMQKDDVSSDEIYYIGQAQTNNIKEEVEQEEVAQEISSEVLEYKNELDIGNLNPGEIKVLSYDLFIEKSNNQDINLSVIAKQGNDQYQSNEILEAITSIDVTLEMDTNIKDTYVEAGDKIEYTIKVNNPNNTNLEGVLVKDNIPAQLSIEEITVNGQIIEVADTNNLEINCDIAANSTTIIKMSTVVNYSEARDEAEAINNKATAEILGEVIAETTEITHIIQANNGANPEDNNNNNEDNNNENNGSENNGSENNNNNNNENNYVEDNDIATGKKIISGVVWFDENSNGIKEAQEQLFENIKVKLLNADTNNFVKDSNGNIVEVTTNEKGIYIFNNIGNGKYILVFDYDISKYTLTQYKVNGTNENSNVMKNTLTINGETQNVASTDIIQVENENISNINMGLVELKTFDLELDKYVSRIIIQNNDGTTVKEYNDSTLAKAEIDAKKIEGANVIIEYKIRVSNIGEIDGYAKKIADYLPSELKFSSELNKDWYQTGNILYNSSLANEVIKAGETREITLVVTKTLTENNLGRINNTAEIAEDYNELGIVDTNSLPGNKAIEENDLGSADVIISIRTGGAAIIATIIIIIILLVAVVVVIIIKKKNKNAEDKK